MSEAKIGENNLGKSLSAGTKALISAAISIVKNIPPLFMFIEVTVLLL